MDHRFAVDHDMLAAYRQGRLGPVEFEAFEIHFITCPSCQRDLETDESLTVGLAEVLGAPVQRLHAAGMVDIHSKAAGPAKVGKHTWLKLYAAAASVLLVVAIGALVWQKSVRRSYQVQSASAQILYFARTREVSGPVNIDLDPHQQQVVLVLDAVQPEFVDYEVKLMQPGQGAFWSAPGIAAVGTEPSFQRQIVIVVPMNALPEGQIEVQVVGRRESGRRTRSATFRVLAVKHGT